MSTARRKITRGQLSLLDDVAWCRRCGRRLTGTAAVTKRIGRTCLKREREEREHESKIVATTGVNGAAESP